MKNPPFIGRKKDLEALNLLLKKKTASLVVVQGRRRIGKSRLIQEFGKKHRFLTFSGLPPTPQTTDQIQRNAFMRQLASITNLPEVQVDDWSKAFQLLGNELKTGKTIVLLDEISWMGSKDPDFLGKLKTAWDLQFKQNPELMLILCSSISIWIEENILSSTAYLGRVSLTLNLKELSLPESNQLLIALGHKLTAYDTFKVLGITGGIPRYLEEFNAELSVDENIKRLCLMESGILYREFNHIFSDLFTTRADTYKKIVKILVNGALDYNSISEKAELAKGGLLSDDLQNLILSGFVTRDYTWSLKTGKLARLSHYRLSDNYLRFYLKYIEPNRDKISKGYYEEQALSAFPSWDTVMGLQFENLVLNNRKLVWQALCISPPDILSDNPFFQRKTTRIPGCQIDYMIHTKYDNLYICEIKFSRNPIKQSVIAEMKRKIEHLVTPKGFAYRPVLIHMNTLEDAVEDNAYFSNIIDFSNFLE